MQTVNIPPTRRTGVAILLAAMVLLQQCTIPRPFMSPKIIGGNDSTVSIEAGQGVTSHGLAEHYCAAYNKTAVYLGSTVLSADDLTRMYGYDCVSQDR